MSIAIKVENLTKKYIIGAQKQERYIALRDVLAQGIHNIGRTFAHPFRKDKEDQPQEFFALKDVNFEIEQGERVGIIGRNGAGKSTLLKILSRITEPTKGRVCLKGTAASLLEVGTGFHPELTGRENIYLNGAILGMKKAAIRRKFDEIVAFSEIEKFIDTPVKRYSSGMYVRLAFAVAAHLEPDILLVDEVLAVGDAAFQKKCLGKMGEVSKEGRTVLFVSHNMQALRNLCERSILLDKGSIIKSGETQHVISTYLRTMESLSSQSMEQIWDNPDKAPGNDKIRLHKIRLFPEGKKTSDEIDMDTPFVFEIEYWNLMADTRLILDLCLHAIEGDAVFESLSLDEPRWNGQPFPKALFRTSCKIPGNLLNEGTYRIRILFINDDTVKLYNNDEAVVFSVKEKSKRKIQWYGKYKGFVHPRLDWQTEFIQ